MSAATLAIVYWCVKIVGALLIAAAAFVKLVLARRDKQRVKSCGGAQLHSHTAAILPIGAIRERTAATFSSTVKEPVAYLGDVIHKMHTGDALFFAGVRLHSWINRIAEWTRFSHYAKVYRDVDGRLGPRDKVYAAEVVERFRIYFRGWRPRIDLGGFRYVPIDEYVAKYPGQLYWAPIASEYTHRYNRQKVKEAIENSEHWGYGWLGIGLQILVKAPFVCVITYLATWRRIDVPWNAKWPPYCSWAGSLWDSAGGQDPVPCLAPQLTGPGSMERSKLYVADKISLMPDVLTPTWQGEST